MMSRFHYKLIFTFFRWVVFKHNVKANFQGTSAVGKVTASSIRTYNLIAEKHATCAEQVKQ